MVDVFPQPIKWTGTYPNATTDLGIEIRIPQILPDIRTDKRVVTELLYLKFDNGGAYADLVAETDNQNGVRFALPYSPLLTAEIAPDGPSRTGTIGDTNILAVWGALVDSKITTSGTTALAFRYIEDYDFKGGGLTGKLIPTDRIYLNVSTDVDLSTLSYGFELYYRQHIFGLAEWFGIIASLQQNPA